VHAPCQTLLQGLAAVRQADVTYWSRRMSQPCCSVRAVAPRRDRTPTVKVADFGLSKRRYQTYVTGARLKCAVYVTGARLKCQGIRTTRYPTLAQQQHCCFLVILSNSMQLHLTLPAPHMMVDNRLALDTSCPNAASDCTVTYSSAHPLDDDSACTWDAGTMLSTTCLYSHASVAAV
jgi:hypothetical protein